MPRTTSLDIYTEPTKYFWMNFVKISLIVKQNKINSMTKEGR